MSYRPEHYGGPDNPFEPIKIIRYYDLNFCEGNILKYLLRSKGDRIKDLKKLKQYTEFEIERLENK